MDKKTELKKELKRLGDEINRIKLIRSLYSQGKTNNYIGLAEQKKLEHQFAKVGREYRKLIKPKL